MSDPTENLRPTPGSESAFRRGADHAAHWFYTVATTMARDGASAGQIASHLLRLNYATEHWRYGRAGIPTGNPWEWSHDEINAVLKRYEESDTEKSAE
jgi:hypothetical protein